jgi:peptidoglycan/LPS O-acetylase OafA/YrhL
LPYVRAIDGLRAVAVMLVLAFHGEVPGVEGGFLGVSLFFTLSGYLITQLLVREQQETGRLSLRSFWARRLRRLAPASLLCLGAVALISATTDVFPGRSVRVDVVAAAANVANWRFAFESSSYADIFSEPSPVAHFWSLSIEEQFYLVFPILVAAVLASLGRRALPVVFAVIIVMCLLAVLTVPADIAYYASFGRAPELLTGALLALVLPFGRRMGEAASRALAVAGVVGAAALCLLVTTTEVTDRWLYRGGFAAISLISCAVLASTTVPGLVQRLCSRRAAVAVGRCSYGLYVYHWPTYLLLTPQRVGFSGAGLLALRLAVTGVVAAASLVLLENPIRRQQRLARAPRGRVVLAAGLAGVLLIAVLNPAVDPAPPIPPAADAAGVVSFSRHDPPERQALDVLVLGTAPQVADWVREAPVTGVPLAVRSAVRPGCPLLLPDREDGACPSFTRAAMSAFAQGMPDLVVVGVGLADRLAIAGKVAMLSVVEQDVRLQLTKEILTTSAALVAAMLDVLPDRPIILVDSISAARRDPLAVKLREASLRRNGVRWSWAQNALGLAADVDQVIEGSGVRSLRVLVIGDSTSYQLADGLDAMGGERLDVEWAGGPNCGIGGATEVRWGPGFEFDRSDCPSPTSVWPDVVARFRPDVVLAVASLPELSDQRFDGDGQWVEPGEPVYTRMHDARMAELQSLLSASGAVTMVATVPPLNPVESFRDHSLTSPSRLTAWLEQILRWDRQWRSVGVLDWGTMVQDAERTEGRSLRIDVVHLDPRELVSILGPRLMEEFLTATASLRADAREAGCRIGSGASARLDPAKCRTE